MVLLPITLVPTLLTVVGSPITPLRDTEGKLAIPQPHTNYNNTDLVALKAELL